MIECVISGGQTGVDRAALDAALELEFDCGGWCPKGRRAEDGAIHERYPLDETASPEYEERTAANVRDSDGTLILTTGSPTGGTAYTIACAERANRPFLIIDLGVCDDPDVAVDWAETYEIQIMNVAGPRESTQPGIYDKAKIYIAALLLGTGAT